MFFTDNPVSDFENHDREQEEELKKRPVCVLCGEHIQDDEAYYIAGDWYCRECIDDCRKDIEC